MKIKENILKFFILLCFIIFFFINLYNDIKFRKILNDNYLELQKKININFHNKIRLKINIAVYGYCIKNGGRARLTALMVSYFYKIKIFNIYLFTKKNKEDNEYSIPKNIKRIIINNNNLIYEIKKNKIDIFIYQLSDYNEITLLNNLKKIKVIFYQHSCFFYWIYLDKFNEFKNIYKALQDSKYVITLVPFENDYLFKKWGINSILMYNFLTYNTEFVEPSDLSANIILMIGRGNDKLKRFELGIKSMKYIVKEVPDCEMKIISNIDYIGELKNLTYNLNLENNINFVGYSSSPEIYFKNASLHIFPTMSESFGYVLCETKIYGIPNILLGLDYVSISKGGTIIIYDESPKTIGFEAIKILKNDEYKKRLGNEARKSMELFNNDLLNIRWVKLILSIYNGENYYQLFRDSDIKISLNDSINILYNQVKLLKIRKPIFNNITIKDIENFSFLENLNYR